jgi:hypothetical protein
MAPQKPPKNKNPQQDATTPTDGMGASSPFGESLPVRPAMVSQPSETYEKAQEDEREVLKAVFMDDYEESEATGAWSVSTQAAQHDCDWHNQATKVHVSSTKSSRIASEGLHGLVSF